MNRSVLLFSLLIAAAAGSARAQDKPLHMAPPAAGAASCDAKSTLPALHAASKKLAQTPYANASGDKCTSLLSVLKRLLLDSKPAGRKLEKDKPLNLQAAERERLAALAHPDFSRELALMQADETDPQRRQLLEAALLDDFGHYQARDLVLQQISTSLGLNK